ncbi:carbohydrate binding domain-containing protein [Sediminitomix flava]|uniref:Putative secreted protein (Por secretion system target) n=1 Tax=Sediminitomix flava TaxID=379075 RepID=A0A315Z4A7_SEDFL|nr:carbohydrate binding domain-containing protein [Sediminitomix flava]PWJ37919.1 putative secreted protein (Por secretion system target) [Sediminitomix flava]
MQIIHKLLVFILLVSSFKTLADPPEPKKGYRWVLNKRFSDEFNGTSLNGLKWRNYFDGWKGRPPAKFVPSSVSVKDGYMQIKNAMLDQADGSYIIAGGAVQSLSSEASYGYYECRFKSSKIRMSTTFWLSNKKELLDETECTTDRYSQELDISETVGGHTGTFQNHMHSNTHYRHIPCGESKEVFHSAGAKKELASTVWEDFHTYACWWENAYTAHFYADGEYFTTVDFDTSIDATAPFDRPMRVNMVTETYDWITPPEEADLRDDAINTSYYDWIRAYTLVPIDEVIEEEVIEETPLLTNAGFEEGNLNGWQTWGNVVEVVSDNFYSGENAIHVIGGGAPEQVISLKPNTTYTLRCYAKVVSGSINLGVKEGASGAVTCSGNSYQKYELEFTTDDSGKVKIYFYAIKETDEGYADDFELTEKDAVVQEPEIFEIYTEELSFSEDLSALEVENEYEILMTYKANFDRTIKLVLKDKNGNSIAETSQTVLAGYGKDSFTLPVNTTLTKGEKYIIEASLSDQEIGETVTNISQTVQIGQVEEPQEPTTILGTEDLGSIQTIFPNPVETVLNLKGIDVGSQFKIFTLQGQMIRSGIISSDTIPVESLKRGSYLLSINDKLYRRFIKK